MKEIILAYQGEMTLKGLNRGTFEAKLNKAIRHRLADLGEFKIRQAQSTVFIQPLSDDIDMDEAFRRISKIFGIVKLSRAAVCDKDFDSICATAEAYLGQTLRGIKHFQGGGQAIGQDLSHEEPRALPGTGRLSAVQAPLSAGGRPQSPAGDHGGDPGLRRLYPRPQGPRCGRPAGGHQRPGPATCCPAASTARWPAMVYGPARPGAASHPFCQRRPTPACGPNSR